MNKLFSKIAALSVGLAMAVGVGVALGHEGVGEAKADSQSITLTAASGGTFGVIDVAISKADGSSEPIYNSSYGVRLYAKNTLTISAAGYSITAVSIGWTKNSKKTFATVTADVGTYTHPSAAGTGTWSGSSDTIVFTVGASGQIQVKTLSVTYVASTEPSVSIDNLPSSIDVGATGTLTASSLNATNPTYTWSSDSEILTIDENTGAYTANAYGEAEVTVSMTCDEGSATRKGTIAINGVDTISAAAALALDPGTDKTTAFSVLVEGYVTSLDPDTKTRAFNISDTKVGTATSTDTIMVYGIYSDNAMRNYVILNGLIKFRAKVQNYKGTVQLSSYTLVSYSDAAMTYAKTAYESLNEACTTGPAAVTDEQWNGLATDFGALDEYARAKLAAAGSDYAYSEDIANWIGRYGRIVAAGRSNFMENVNVSSQYLGTFENSSNNSYIIIIVISAVSVMSFGLALFLRKKKSK